MVFIQMVQDHAEKIPTAKRVVNIPQITEELFDDGEHKEIFEEIAQDLASGCDPIPFFITQNEAVKLMGELQCKLLEAEESIDSFDTLTTEK